MTCVDFKYACGWQLFDNATCSNLTGPHKNYKLQHTHHITINMKISCYALLAIPSASAFFAAPRVSQQVSTTVSKTFAYYRRTVMRKRTAVYSCSAQPRSRWAAPTYVWRSRSRLHHLFDILHQLTPPLFLFLLPLHAAPCIFPGRPLSGKHRRGTPRSPRAQQRRTIGHSLTRWNPALRYRTLGRRIHLDHPR